LQEKFEIAGNYNGLWPVRTEINKNTVPTMLLPEVSMVYCLVLGIVNTRTFFIASLDDPL